MDCDLDETKATRNREKSADELFQELGFKKSETDISISFRGKISSDCGILFYKIDKTIIFEKFNTIDISQLQAINKKVEELGWKYV